MKQLFLFIMTVLTPFALQAKADNPFLVEIAAETAKTMNAYLSFEKIIESSELSDFSKSKLRADLGPVVWKSKLEFKAVGESIVVSDKGGSVSVTLRMVNPMAQKYVVNNYPTSLFAKSPDEKLNYLKRVLKSNPKSASHSLFSLFFRSAMADVKAVLISTDLDAAKFSVALLGADKAASTQACSKYSDPSARKSNKLEDIVTGSNVGKMSEFGAKVGASFWCGNLNGTLSGKQSKHAKESIHGFSVRCEGRKIDSVAIMSKDYVQKIDLITKDSKGIFKDSARDALEKSMGSDFADKVAKCCESTACVGELNSIAPILEKGEPTELHNAIKAAPGTTM